MNTRNYKFPQQRSFKNPTNQKNQFNYTYKFSDGSKFTGNWKFKNSVFEESLKQDAPMQYPERPSKSSQYSFLRKTIDYPGAQNESNEFQMGKHNEFHSNKLRSTVGYRDEPYFYQKPDYNYEKYSKAQKQRELNFLSKYQNYKKLKSYTNLHSNDKPINEQEHSQNILKKGVVSPRNRARTQGEDYITQRLKMSIQTRATENEEKIPQINKNQDFRKFTKKSNFQCYTPNIDYDDDISPTSPARTSPNISPYQSKYFTSQIESNTQKKQLKAKKQFTEKEISSPTTTQTTSIKSFSFKLQKMNQKMVSIDDFYLGEKLGEGRYGNVYKAFHKQTGAIFALKKLKKDQIKQHNLMLQIKMQLMFNHSNILKLYGFFNDTEYLYLILQFMPNKTLFSYLKQKGKLSEKDASRKMHQIIQAIDYLHSKQIAHRDLKPENIVMCDDTCKLCDFGSSAVFDNRRKTIVGTPDYACPEVLIGEEYGIQIDYWCLGVLCYELLIGKAPFYHHRVKQTFKKIINVDKTELVFPQTLSDQAIQFISLLLVKNPDDRMGTDEALKHPFITMYIDDESD